MVRFKWLLPPLIELNCAEPQQAEQSQADPGPTELSGDEMDRAVVELQSQIKKLNRELSTKSAMLLGADRERQTLHNVIKGQENIIKDRDSSLSQHCQKYENLLGASRGSNTKLEEEIFRLKKVQLFLLKPLPTARKMSKK